MWENDSGAVTKKLNLSKSTNKIFCPYSGSVRK